MEPTNWKAFWNGHYNTAEAPWVDPDPLFTAEAAALAPGRALDLGCGEGASALWLAARGWQVKAVDFAASGIATLERLARERGLTVVGEVCDILAYRPAPEFDLVTLGYMHLTPAERRQMHGVAAAALKPGGTLIYLGFDRDGDLSNVDFAPDLISTHAELRTEFPGLAFDRLETISHEMDFGDGPIAFPVIVGRGVRSLLAIEPGDPHEARALLEASHAMMLELFTPESNHFLSLDALAGPDIRFLVARLDGRVAGCAALALRDGYGEIKSMFVDPQIRRTGIAGGLMHRLEIEARALGFPSIRLETGNLLEAAQELYRRHGYFVRGPFGEYSEHPHSVFMEKRLD